MMNRAFPEAHGQSHIWKYRIVKTMDDANTAEANSPVFFLINAKTAEDQKIINSPPQTMPHRVHTPGEAFIIALFPAVYYLYNG